MNKRTLLIFIIVLLVLGSYNFKKYNPTEKIVADYEMELRESIGLPDNFTNEKIKMHFWKI